MGAFLWPIVVAAAATVLVGIIAALYLRESLSLVASCAWAGAVCVTAAVVEVALAELAGFWLAWIGAAGSVMAASIPVGRVVGGRR